MVNLNNSKGFLVTGASLLIVILLVILIPSFSSAAFFCRNWARIDSLRQQAYYGAEVGIELERFRIEHPDVTVITPPRYRPYMTTVTSDGGTGYYITSTSRIRDALGITIAQATINVHVAGGVQVDSWN